MRPRSDSAPAVRTGHDDDTLLAQLHHDCRRAAVNYVNNLVTDRPDTVASCTFYRSGTLVVTRPEAAQEVPRHIDATESEQIERIVVSRKAAAARDGDEHYDLVHIADQPSVRVLFVHLAAASDALVRAAAVRVVNDDVATNVTFVAATQPPLPPVATSATTGEFDVVVLDEKGDSVSTRPVRKKHEHGRLGAGLQVTRRTDGSDGCDQDLEAAKANAIIVAEATDAAEAIEAAAEAAADAVARRCVIL